MGMTSPVTPTGTASVTQMMTDHNTTASVHNAWGESPFGTGAAMTAKKIPQAPKKPSIFFRLGLVHANP